MKRLAFVLGVVIFFAGCTHELRVTNEHAFNPSLVKTSDPVKIGFLPTEDKLVNSVIEEIALSTSVKEVKKNCAMSSEMEVDYIAGLSESMKFRASGQNFFITFPGFIIFAHSLFGYKYYIDIDTNSKIFEPNGKTLSEVVITTPYEIRYTSFARGAASSLIGWFTPGLGALDIIPGAIFASSYDDRATYEFIEKVRPSYKAYVSSKVLEQIAGVRKTAASGPISFKMAPVVIGDEISKESANSVGNRMFAVHVMKIENGRFVPYVDIQREMPETALQLLNKITQQEGPTDSNNLRDILLSFGISDMQFPKDLAGVNIYSMKDNKMVKLFEGGILFSWLNRDDMYQ